MEGIYKVKDLEMIKIFGKRKEMKEYNNSLRMIYEMTKGD